MNNMIFKIIKKHKQFLIYKLMRTRFLKYNLLLVLTIVGITSCVSDDDYQIPVYRKVLLSENFESLTAGSGSNEIAVSLENWINVNTGTGDRLWHVRQFNNNKFADFSSNFSDNAVTDENWLITPEIQIEKPSSFRFSTEVRFHNFDNLSVWISTNYDGTTEGISTADWQPLEAFISGASENGNNTFTESGEIDLSQYIDTKIRIGFKYVGSKSANQSSTYRIDNITIFEN